MWKLYRIDALKNGPIVGRSLADWRAAPLDGVLILMVADPDGPRGLLVNPFTGERRPPRSRVGYIAGRSAYWDQDHYILGPDGQPASCSPDVVLLAHARRTGRTDVKLDDLTLDDYVAIDVKLGQSSINEDFEAILELALNDPAIP